MSLLNKLTSDSTLSKKTCEILFKQIFEVIKELIMNREIVAIDNFGLFKVERRKTQTMIDYNRKVVVLLPPKDKIIFEFKDVSKGAEINTFMAPVFSSKKIVNLVSQKTGIDEITVYEFLNILFEVIRESLEGKKNINIIEFGKFKVSGKNKISFSPAKKFADKVNYNFNNLRVQIIRSLNKEEIKKLYRERLHYPEGEEIYPEKPFKVEDIITAKPEKKPVQKAEEPVKKDYIHPQVKKEEKPEEIDAYKEKEKLKTEITEEDEYIKEKIETDFKTIEEMFEEEEYLDNKDEIYKGQDFDILLMQDTEEAVEPVKTEEKISDKTKDVPPEFTVKTEEPEIIKEEESIEHPYYTPVKDSPITEKIITDFEDKVKSFLKQAAEEREIYGKELDKEKQPEHKVTLQDMTGIPEPSTEEIEKEPEPEISFIGTLDKIIKDDEDEIDVSEIKTAEETKIPESFKEITETLIEDDIIKSAGKPDEEKIYFPSEPPVVQTVEEEISEEIEDNIPMSEVYRKLREGFMEKAEDEIKEKTETREEPKDRTVTEPETPSITIERAKETEPSEPEEISIQEISFPEFEEPEIKLPEPEPEIPSPQIPEIKLPESEEKISLKDDEHLSEELTFEAKKKEFEKQMQKYSEEFKPEKFIIKDEENLKATESTAIPPAEKQIEKSEEIPFKSTDDTKLHTKSDDTIEDLKSFIDEINKKTTETSDLKTGVEETPPFKKVEDIDLPKSIDDYFEEIEEEFKKRKQNKNKDKQ